MASRANERTPLLSGATSDLNSSSSGQNTPANAASYPPNKDQEDIVDAASQLYSDESEDEPTVGSTADHLMGISAKQFWTFFSVILCLYVVAFFDSTLMESIHPVITTYFHAANSASWLSTSFLLATTAFSPFFGRLSDTFGRRPVFLFSIIVFFLTTAWCACSQTIVDFIIARAFCGLGAGGVTAMGVVICSDLIHVEYRGIYQSYINLAYGVGSSLGLACGGLLADKVGWRATFAVQLPFILLGLIVTVFTMPTSLGPELAKTQGYTLRQAVATVDLKGSFLLMVAVTMLLVFLNLGGNVLPWLHPLVLLSLVGFILATICLLCVERFAPRPILPLKLLRYAPRANLIFSNFFAAMAIRGTLFNVPLFFQAVKRESPSKSSMQLLGSSGGLLVTSVATGFMITWTRRLKPMLLIGALFILITGTLASLLSRSSPVWMDVILVSPASIGQGFAFPATTLAVLATSTQEEQAVVTTTLTLFRTLGSVLGVSLCSWMLQTVLPIFLRLDVTVPGADGIIDQVRRSVGTISNLEPTAQNQGMSIPQFSYTSELFCRHR